MSVFRKKPFRLGPAFLAVVWLLPALPVAAQQTALQEADSLFRVQD